MAKKYYDAWVGCDLQGDHCIYITSAPGHFLSEPELSKIARKLTQVLNEPTSRKGGKNVQPKKAH